MSSIIEGVKEQLANFAGSLENRFSSIEKRLRDEKLEVDDPYYFQWEKGKALKRMSTPLSAEEASSLGDFNVLMNLALNALKSLEKDINRLCFLDDYELTSLADNIFRGTASKKALRLLTVGHTIETIKPDFNQSSPTMIAPQPIQYGFEDTESGERGKSNKKQNYEPRY